MITVCQNLYFVTIFSVYELQIFNEYLIFCWALWPKKTFPLFSVSTFWGFQWTVFSVIQTRGKTPFQYDLFNLRYKKLDYYSKLFLQFKQPRCVAGESKISKEYGSDYNLLLCIITAIIQSSNSLAFFQTVLFFFPNKSCNFLPGSLKSIKFTIRRWYLWITLLLGNVIRIMLDEKCNLNRIIHA